MKQSGKQKRPLTSSRKNYHVLRKYTDKLEAILKEHSIPFPAFWSCVVALSIFNCCPACKDTEDPQFIKDEGIPALIPGGYAFASLVSHIMYEKYADALPLYRQEKGFELLGVSISRTTVANWIITCAQNYLKPVYDYFHRELLKRHFLMADETPI